MTGTTKISSRCMVITFRIYSGSHRFRGRFGKYLEVSLHYRRKWRRGICYCLSRCASCLDWYPYHDSRNHAGRRSQRNPIETMELLTEEAGADSNWHYLGWMGVTAGVLILSYYSVIAGWASAYIVKAFAGSFFDADGTAIKGIFNDFVASPVQLIFWHSLFMAATMLIVVRGVSNGLEYAVRL